jgi:L-ascorbate metabolism protein UlaG (beta-lactamase superfamily)
MQIQRLGHSMFRLVTDQGYVIAVDPWIRQPELHKGVAGD